MLGPTDLVCGCCPGCVSSLSSSLKSFYIENCLYIHHQLMDNIYELQLNRCVSPAAATRVSLQ